METTLDVTLTFSWPVALPPELRGKRGFILHDFQCTDFGAYLPRVYGKKDGLPETEKLGDAQFEKMNEDWQWFWFNWLRYYSPHLTLDTAKRRWADLIDGMKAFTNTHGPQHNNRDNTLFYADYINNWEVDKDPSAQETLTTCGNVVILSGNEKNIGGKKFFGVLCLDRTLSPPTLPPELVDYFIHSATVCRPEKGTEPNFPRHSIAPNGTFIVNNFPHTDGGKVPVPLATTRGAQSIFMGVPVRENWINADRLCPLDDDETTVPIVK